jgi:hypothetical protein
LLVEEGHAGAQAIQRLQRRLRRALMVSQLGALLAGPVEVWVGVFGPMGRSVWLGGTPRCLC